MTADLDGAFGRIDEFLRKTMRNLGIPGMSLGITDRNGLLRVSNIGLADVGSHKPLGEDTLFEIGSISKSFASVVALQLAEEGKLDLHAPVKDYLPWLEIKSKHAPVTLHHLLSHTAGIIRGTEITGFGPSEVKFLEEFETCSPPGTYFWYSNTGYKVVGAVIESLLERRCAQAVQERVLAPLGMTRSSTEITHGIRDRLATGYAPRFDDRPRQPGMHVVQAPWIESDTADGSISSTAADMCAYARMYLNSGAAADSRLLSEASFRSLTQRAAEPADAVRGEAYGYGLEVYEDRGHSMIGHTGGMVGFTSALLMDMDLGLGVILLTNALTDAGELARRIMASLRSEAEGEGVGLNEAEPNRIESAARYEGTFVGDKGTLRLRAKGDRLLLETGDGWKELESRSPDGFYADSMVPGLFLLKPEEANGQVLGIARGPDSYAKEGSSPAPNGARHPRAWKAYPGHYRTYNPWISNFRVVLRRGAMFMIEPSGHEEPLIPVARSLFRVGADERSPERLRFCQVVDGVALEADLSGCPCYRTFTP